MTTEMMETGELSEKESINLESFSELVGFPADFIKKELLLDKENLSIDELRESVLNYLNDTMK